jgi:leader peptidase (prepilin peptidase)/N-methyltransferase
MGIEPIFDPVVWARVPFHFWSLVFFVFGSMVGSFLNVCIYRMPLGQSVVSPPSHCPSCKYAIPWFLNLPLITWLALRGKCKNCAAPISPRYFLVELLTGVAFLACWLNFGPTSAWLALVYAIFLAGLIVATFIDFEHLIIPDEINFGGMVAGVLISCALPGLHGETSLIGGMKQSVLGLTVGGGVIYAVVRMGKLAFGRQRIDLSPDTKIVFTESALHLPDKVVGYEEIFYRKSDTIKLQARTVELLDRGYSNVCVRLALLEGRLQIGEDELNPENCPHMEVVVSELVLPREAMGLGDVKFMAAIGAFLGWQATLFSLMASSMIGSVYALSMIALKRQAWSGRIYFGPFIAAAAVIWVFRGKEIFNWIFPGF